MKIEAKTNKIIAADTILLPACAIAARTFRNYERLHRAKGTIEGNRKADENGWLAKAMEDAVDQYLSEKP